MKKRHYILLPLIVIGIISSAYGLLINWNIFDEMTLIFCFLGLGAGILNIRTEQKTQTQESQSK